MKENSINVLAGWMIFGLIAVGLFGFFGAVLALLNEYDYVGVGLCLLASAFAFGQVINAYK